MSSTIKDEMRSPICTVMGHVDHGKSSILDFIRHTNIVDREAGAITQAIGASIVPMDTLRNICGKNLKDLKRDHFNLPGLLFIDTPGHAAFTNLRKRGGNLADIAILVVDLNEGFMPQTIEAIQILKQYKTPFIIAANKVDLAPGYRSSPKESVLININKQTPEVITYIETKLYEIVGKVHEHGEFESERFDRVQDFTKQIAIVPISAKQGDGLPELLMLLTGLAQKFLEKTLHFNLLAPAKGTVLEVKEEQGIGISLDVIIYDGNLKVGDSILVGSLGEPVSTKVRCLFEPLAHSEMMDKKSKYKPVKQVFAATGVKVAGPGLDHAVAGMPLVVVDGNLEEAKQKMLEEIEEVIVDTEDEGIIVKADSLGSVEALVRLLKEEGFSVRKASVGDINKKDLLDAESNFEDNPMDCVILGFNIKPHKDEKVTVLTSNIIYSLIEEYKQWKVNKTKELEMKKLHDVNRPAKVEYLQNHTFRQNNPAIIGVEVIDGTLKAGTQIMTKTGLVVGFVKQIQKSNKSVTIAKKKDQVAIAIDGATCGRQIHEGDILYSYIIESDFTKLKSVKDFLESGEKVVLKEVAEIMREDNPVWGV